MKKNIALFGAMVLVASWLSPEVYAVPQSAVAKSGQPQKKGQRIRTVITKDGKVIESDTTIVDGDDKAKVKVQKEMIILADSTFHNMGNGLKNRQVTVTVTDNGEKDGKINTFTYTIGDTLKNDLERKVIRLNDGKKMIIMQGGEDAASDPSGLTKNTGGNRIVRRVQDHYSMDASDPNIVSYEKKDVGKGLEKIVIVRKKVVER